MPIIGDGDKTMNALNTAPTVASEVRTFVLGERKTCLSDREWKFRLRGYGYDIRATPAGKVVTTLPAGVVLCTLD